MTLHKTARWLFILGGALWVLAGMRDLLAPGFLSPNGRIVTGSGIAFNFAIGIVFLIIGGLQSAGIRKERNRS